MYKVIVADDEPLMLEGWQTIIDWQRFGYELCGLASDGDEAFELATRIKPDLLVTDIRMPGLDGLALIRSLRERQELRIKSVIVSGYAEFDYAQQALRCGVDRYVLKPIITEEIHTLLEDLQASLAASRVARDSHHAYDTAQQDCILRLLRGESKAIKEAETLLAPSQNLSLCLLLIEHRYESASADLTPVSRAATRIVDHLEAASISAWMFQDTGGTIGVLANGSPIILNPYIQPFTATTSEYACYARGSVRDYDSLPVLYGEVVAAREQARSIQQNSGYANSWLAKSERVYADVDRADQPPESKPCHPVQAAIAYMRQHYRDKLQLRELAEQLHLHPVYLGQEFKREVGCGFNDYIHRLRAEEAQRLLHRTDMKIAEVAKRLGYHDTEYFSTKFKAATGELPSVYRVRKQVAP